VGIFYKTRVVVFTDLENSACLPSIALANPWRASSCLDGLHGDKELLLALLETVKDEYTLADLVARGRALVLLGALHAAEKGYGYMDFRGEKRFCKVWSVKYWPACCILTACCVFAACFVLSACCISVLVMPILPLILAQE
jgi:hypothetical protein